MSFFKDIQAALDTRLSLLSGGTPVAWENVEYTPVKGTAYLRPTLLSTPSHLMDLNSLQNNEGIYQIDLFYPTNNGVGDLLTKADQIYDHFKTDLTLVSNSTTVHVKEISRATVSAREEAWFRASIELHYKCYSA